MVLRLNLSALTALPASSILNVLNPNLKCIQQEIYSITFSSFPDDQATTKNVPIDLLNNRLESIIVDNQSSGYDAHSLVYLPDKLLLAPCSVNGRVLFWSIGDCVGELNFKGSITFAKYVNLEDKQYLLIVSEDEVHIYDITKKIVLKKVVETSSRIQCIETDLKNKRLIVVSGGNEVTIWNLETFKTIKNFTVEAGSQSNPILSAISVDRGNSLILQDHKGLSKINVDSTMVQRRKIYFEPAGTTPPNLYVFMISIS